MNILNKIRKLREKKGFTLVELIVVIAIIAILTAVLVPLIGNWTQQAAYTTLQDGAQTVSNSINNALSKVTMGGAPASVKSIEAIKAKGSDSKLKILIDGVSVDYDADVADKSNDTNEKVAIEVNNILVATMDAGCGFLASVSNGAVDGIIYRNDLPDSATSVGVSSCSITEAGFDNAYETTLSGNKVALGVSGKFKGKVTVSVVASGDDKGAIKAEATS